MANVLNMPASALLFMHVYHGVIGHVGHTQRSFGSRSASGAQSTTPRRLPACAGNLEELHEI
jgi:hypothetical protein